MTAQTDWPPRFFDSLVHVTADGSWRGSHECDARLARLIAEFEPCTPWRACLVAIAGVIENDAVLRAARQYSDRLLPIGSFNPVACTAAGISRHVERLASDGFRGLKLHPRLNGYDPLEPKVADAIRAAADRGLVVFLDTLFRQPSKATGYAPDVVDALAVACPDATMILLHGGGPAVLAMSEVVAAHPNLVLDVSFTILRYAGSSIDDDLRFLLRTFDRRMVVGSDFPEYSPRETMARVEHLADGISADKLDNVLSGNLTRLFDGRAAQ